MQYACSDLHGFPIQKFKTMLEKINFSSIDHLWVLGDVVDRGTDAVELLRWIMRQPNVTFILGNHEALLLACEFLFEEVTDKSIENLDSNSIRMYYTWMSNGGQTTANALKTLPKDEIKEIFNFLRNAPLYETLTAGGKEFILTHSGLGSFEKNKQLCEYTVHDFLWTRPNIDDKYYDDKTVIFGHTPTLFYSESCKGKALVTDTWIDIDAGVATKLNPMILRLDDLKEIYFDENMEIAE